MAERKGFLARLFSLRTALRLCLVAQVGLGAALVADDVYSGILLEPGATPIETTPTVPIRPGDQSRPWRPAAVPGRKDRRTRLDAPILLPDELPRRLEFTVQETTEHGRVLLLTGAVRAGDAIRFESQLESMAEPPAAVAFHSPGGNVAEAQRIGRLIRGAGLATLISPDGACVSACPYMLAGGKTRMVSKEGWVGLHQHYFKESILPAFLAVKNVQVGQGETMAYLDEMGIDPMILTHALKTPPEDVYFLVEEELLRYRMATATY